jgi:putative RecB family exonuclease
VSDLAFKAGVDAFRESLLEEEKQHDGKVWRSGGRASKRWPNKEDREWWLAEGPTMINNYLVWRKNNPQLEIWHTPDGTPGIEIAINVKMAGVLLNSKIDRVFVNRNTNKTIIVDLKSGKPPQSGLQLAVYRLAMIEQFGQENAPAHGAYWMAREGSLNQIYDLDQYPVAMVSRWLRDVRKAIEMQIFVPNVGHQCYAFCSVQRYCYAHGNLQYLPVFASDLLEERQ